MTDVLDVRGMTVTYGSGRHAFLAVDGIDLSIRSGSVLGLVGESGSGKSTVAKAIMGLAPMTAGTVAVNGKTVLGHRRRDRVERAREVQLIFQDPYSSLNPRMRVGDIITEPLALREDLATRDRRGEVGRLLDLVSLPSTYVDRLPGELSGGQRQRVAIARALAVQPQLIIADEITSALDVSVQAHVLNLLRTIQRERSLAMLFISHNLATVRYLSDHVAVMRGGVLVEQGPTSDVVDDPGHDYTRDLLAAVPRLVSAPPTSGPPAGPASG